MFVAEYRNTMRNAKSKFRERDNRQTVRLAELRRIQAAQRLAIQEQNRILEETIKAQKAEIRRVIQQGNAALARFHQAALMDQHCNTLEDIVRRICRATGITLTDIRSGRRSRHIAFARQAIFYWACRTTRRSLPEIGRYFERDHTTVLHGKREYPKKRALMGRHLRSLDR